MANWVEQGVNTDPLKPKPLGDKNETLNALEEWSKKETWQEKTPDKEGDIQKIVQDIVSLQLPTSEIEALLSKLPIEKRFQVENMILQEQKHQIATMSQEKYAQYLTAIFGKDVPKDVAEMAQSLVADTGEMLKQAWKEISETGKAVTGVATNELREDKRVAVNETQKAQLASNTLDHDLAAQPDIAKGILQAQWMDTHQVMG